MSNIKKFRIVKWKKKPVLQAKNISKSFDGRPVLQNVSLSLFPGEILSYLGPNGAGKSVTFQILIGSLKPDDGELWVSGKRISEIPIHERAKKFRMGYIPQNDSIWRGLTTRENLMAAAQISIRDKKVQEATVEQLLSEFELNDVANVKSINCSGGQRRKICIARSLVNKPNILIMDEPFSALAPNMITVIKNIILRLQKNGISILLSDHSTHNVLSISDNVVLISNGEILKYGKPADVTRDRRSIEVYFGDSF